MPKSITIRSIDRRAGRTYIRVGKNETELPFSTLPELKAWIQAQLSESDELLLAIALAAWVARDGNLANPNQIVGRTITLDLSGNVSRADGVLRIS